MIGQPAVDMEAMPSRRTLNMAGIWDGVVLDSSIGTYATDAPTSRLALDLHCLDKLPLQGIPPLLKGQAVVETPSSEPGTLPVLGSQLVDLYIQRVLSWIDLDLFPLFLKLLSLGDGGGGGLPRAKVPCRLRIGDWM